MFTFQESQMLAVTPGGRRLTGSDVARVEGAMGKLVPPRSLVFALCSNTEGALCGYLAFLHNRVVPLMLDADMDATLLGGLIQTYGPQYIWLPNETAQQALFEGWALRLNAEEYGYRLLENPRPTPNLELHPDLALLLTTSGSTGSPKLVRISYDNLLANAESIAQYLEITAEERPITTLPMHYSYGLSVINSHLLRGATLLLTPRSIMEKEFWAFFREAQNSRSASLLSAQKLSSGSQNQLEPPKNPLRRSQKLLLFYIVKYCLYCSCLQYALFQSLSKVNPSFDGPVPSFGGHVPSLNGRFSQFQRIFWNGLLPLSAPGPKKRHSPTKPRPQTYEKTDLTQKIRVTPFSLGFGRKFRYLCPVLR